MDNPSHFPFENFGKMLIVIGSICIILGLFLLYRDKLPYLKTLGRLPGDIAVEKENFKFYFPITTSILLSVVLSFLLWLFGKK